MMQTLLDTHAAGMRVDRVSPRKWTVWTPTDAAYDALAKALGPTMDAGREGHEYWRRLGLIVSVSAMRKGRDRVRILSPSRPPGGMFSNLRALEREVTI